jgi:hypothetical protein
VCGSCARGFKSATVKVECGETVMTTFLVGADDCIR